MATRAGWVLVLAMLGASGARAQQWRTVDATRQRHGADSTLRVRVEYGAGELRLGAAPPRVLYDMTLRYDAERYAPAHHFDPAARTLVIEAPGSGATRRGSVHVIGIDLGDHDAAQPTRMTLALAPELPLDLSLDLGAAEGRLDLSHLWVDRLRVRSGAADTRLVFGTPNPRRLRVLDIEAGAAGVHATQLGNANAELVQVNAGVGGVDLDFGGAWARDTRVQLHVVLGGVTLRVPPAIGVRVSARTILGDTDLPGLTRRDDGAYYSDNWNSASRKLMVDAHVVLGNVTVHRTVEP